MESREFSEELDFTKYWLVLKRRWLPATGIFGLVFALAALATFMQDPIYEAKGRLRLKIDRTSALVGFDQGSGELKALSSNNSPLDTEAEIIKSLDIAERTIEALDIRNEEGELMSPQTLSSRLKVSPLTGTDILQVSYQGTDPELAAAIVNKIMEVYRLNNIEENRREARAAREFIEEQLPKTEKELQAADANLQQFKQQNQVIALDEEASKAVQLIGNLDDAITQAQSELGDVGARAAELRRQVGLDAAQAINISALSQSPGVAEALRSLQEAQTELEVQRTRYQPSHPIIAQLEDRTNALNALLEQRVQDVLPSGQQPSNGSIQIGDLRRDLIAEYVQTEIQRLGLARRINLLSEAQQAYERRANSLPELERRQRDLERKLNASQTTYETLLSQLDEARIAENQNVGNASIVAESIVPGGPIAPNKKFYLAVGGTAGLLLGLASAFLLDLTDRSIKTVKEGRDLFGYTLLGVIPAFGRSGKPGVTARDVEQGAVRIIIRDMPHSPIREAYQMLQANLKFLSSDREVKVIAVTSSVPREGKSEVSANLAAAIAQVGRRVLLIDADMRKPTQHLAWDVNNGVGLSNVIVGQNKLSEAIQDVGGRLHVLPSGVMPPNPVALLDSKRMASLIEYFSNTYDYVIIDTPPIAGCADALILGRMTDGLLLVMRPGVVDSASATAAKNLLAQSNQHVLGTVANGVDVRSEPDSYFYYTTEYGASPEELQAANMPVPKE
ncbi:polysaccharide biosynthesis tyrosine autokinase [Oculatella sp. LEGE 06141]|uniref:GumC family protein n=1 Tax=Oculatella sp. LEGE 06141 TaxID=1828648 RepID=UPI0018824FE8|nr:polysaccharide biosynthesis tyrosine autokinase [Oculatella sp. LEGE 06141]MBE9179716.1 polysaccharide biosynthesis tyrosine autokinase [Oculatella sp. LEGE 06141]